MRLLLALLLIPSISGCSLLWQPYGGLDMADGFIVTTGTSDGLLLNLETGQSRDLELGTFAKAFLNDDGTRYVTFHQEGLGADCSGRTYASLYDIDGTLLESWEEAELRHEWQNGYFLGENRDWNGNPTDGPTWEYRWGDAISADGSAWARYDHNAEGIRVTSESSSTVYQVDDNHHVALNEDGTIVAGANGLFQGDNERELQVVIRSQEGPNWNWTLPIKGDYPIASIAISGMKVAVTANTGYLLDLTTGTAKKLDTDLLAQSADIHGEAGWMLSDEDGNNAHFVTETQAWQKLLDHTWVQPSHPGWSNAPSAEGVPHDGVTDQHDTPAIAPVFVILALFWVARKV